MLADPVGQEQWLTRGVGSIAVTSFLSDAGHEIVTSLFPSLVTSALHASPASLDALVVATALPTLHLELGAGVEGLSWTVNAYELAFAASILTGATLGDRFGRRRVFVAGMRAEPEH